MMEMVLEGEKACVEADYDQDEPRVCKMLANQPSEYKIVGGRFPTLLGSTVAEPTRPCTGVRPSFESSRLTRPRSATRKKTNLVLDSP